MGFALPLGVVQGINGHDFPVNLYYQVGIQFHQEASPAGLGFSYEPGSITRQVVFVADDNNAGDYEQDNTGGYCTEQQWLQDLQNFYVGLSPFLIGISFIPGVGGAILGYIATLANLAFTMAVEYAAEGGTYSAGGPHVPKYNYDSGHGVGYLKTDAGHEFDLPDIYMVNTPFISGQLVRDGSGANEHFVFKQTGGSGKKDYSTTRVDYDCSGSNDYFKITLKDGTQLFFEQTRKSNYLQYFTASNSTNGYDCMSRLHIRQKTAKPMQWLLTKVIYPDYVDHDATPGPSKGDLGSWIKFQYTENERTDVVQFDDSYQVKPNAVMHGGPLFDSWMYFDDVYLESIATPNESASIEYSGGRKDDLWFVASNIRWNSYVDGLHWGSTGVRCYDIHCNSNCDPVNPNYPAPIDRKILSAIKILSSSGSIIKKVDFATDYSLSPNSFHSTVYIGNENVPPTGNPSGGKLTLKNISITGSDGKVLPPIIFSYVSYNPDGFSWKLPVTQSPGEFPFWVEDKDCWGYYCPSIGMQNDFNPYGLASRSIRTSDKFPYAAAWSLQKLSFPTGMSIQWDYESNRYNKANGSIVKDQDNNATTRYCGGIRVKQISVNDGMNTAKSLSTTSYFYSAGGAGQFDDNTYGTSGQATVEPYNYISDDEYRREPNTQGGLYTAAPPFLRSSPVSSCN
jgi:hypothetical protein